jgi:hypothetical protein
MCPLDADEDGEEPPECGGCDCDDSDDRIRCGIEESCSATPDLCDDGIDQNCDGSDCTCVVLFSAEWPSRAASPSDFPSYYDYDDAFDFEPQIQWTPSPFGDGSAYRSSVAEGPLLLIAVAGDDRYASGAGTGNVGLTTFEVTAISTADDATNGSLLGWTVQANAGGTNQLPAGRRTLGLDALLYFDFLFAFPAVDSESRATQSVTVQTNSASRFPFDEAGSGATVIDRFESSSSSFTFPRAYYSLTRVNGGLFLVGGRDDTGPVESVERAIP